jgi:hypothetical protein
MRVGSANKMKKQMRRGRVYRRDQLTAFSSAVDRDLKELVEAGDVIKAGAGLYYRPKMSTYGPLPAEERELLKAFLKDDSYLSVSPNLFNELGVGLTQVYNATTVYNRRRHEKITLDGRAFDFRRPRDFPFRLSREYLLVNLVDNLKYLAEDTSRVRERVKEIAYEVDRHKLLAMARRYGKIGSREFFESLKLNDGEALSS